MGGKALGPGVNWPGRETDHSSPPGTEDENNGRIHLMSLDVFRTCIETISPLSALLYKGQGKKFTVQQAIKAREGRGITPLFP